MLFEGNMPLVYYYVLVSQWCLIVAIKACSEKKMIYDLYPKMVVPDHWVFPVKPPVMVDLGAESRERDTTEI